MQYRELFFFEWVLVDNCNLNCSYCVNKGEYSQKSTKQMTYIPGLEIEIARNIVNLSSNANCVVVNLTGGEPLLSDYFVEVLTILASAGNIRVNLVTNLKRIDKYAEDLIEILPSLSIVASLHVHFRSHKEIDCLVEFINAYKDRLAIGLSQVNHDLIPEDLDKLAKIKHLTGLPVAFQTFIPPWTEKGKVEKGDEIRDANFVSSFGKRCSLGYSHFFLLPDGTIYYDQWCNTKLRKSGDFLRLGPDNFDQFILDDMKKCYMQSCGCNYNLFRYTDYMAACKRLKYSKREIFGQMNERFMSRLKRFISGYIRT